MLKGNNSDVKFFGNCPICRQKFKASNTHIIRQKEISKTVYAECGKCASSVLLGIVKNMPGIVTTVGMLTDMKEGDISRFARLAPLTYDDVLEMHICLESFGATSRRSLK
jgi:hypothetical protein